MSIPRPFSAFQHFEIGAPDARDFLQRQPILLDQTQFHKHFFQTKILVTGAAGSIGSELSVRIAFFNPAELVLVDQAETPLHELEMRLRMQFPALIVHSLIADISDKCRIQAILERYMPEAVFHAAAYKHVVIMENHPYEAFKTNVLGTRILADAAIQAGVKKFVFVSTDKAVNPAGVMGASKRLAELYVLNIPRPTAGATEFVVTRFGNVFGSAGSFVPIFKKQIESGGPLTITDPEARRFLITMDEACQLVLEAFVAGRQGDTLTLDMGEPVRVADVADRLLAYYGFSEKDIPIAITGLRAGEKRNEELCVNGDHWQPRGHPGVHFLRHRPDDSCEWRKLLGRFLDHPDPGLKKMVSTLLANTEESLVSGAESR